MFFRLLDEFGDGLGLPQAIPYMEPQLLTFMALEGRLEAVEVLKYFWWSYISDGVTRMFKVESFFYLIWKSGE